MYILSTINPMITSIFIGAVGACLGSYAALVIKNMPEEISTISPRSHCDTCASPLRIWQKIPVFSWLLLRGRCFFCRAPIGLRVVFIEVLFALAAVAIFQKYGLSILGFEKYFFVFLLVCLSYIDLDTFYLPNNLIYFLLLLGVSTSAYFYMYPSEYLAPFRDEPFLRHMVFSGAPGFSLSSRLLGALFGFVSLFGINIVATAMLRKSGRLHKGQWAMGFGDPLLMMAIGLFVGLNHLMLTIFLASFLGSIFGVAQKFLGRRALPTSDLADGAVPFGPFLSLAAIYVYLF